MFSKLFAQDTGQTPSVPREGELFKVIHLYGKTFEIRYGFYEECERHNRFAEPVPIYPDFIRSPQHTDDGTPFVTAMQNPCENFDGKKDADSVCGDCARYRHCDELLGICTCPLNNRGQQKNESTSHYLDMNVATTAPTEGGQAND